MPFEISGLSVADRVEMLNGAYRHHAAIPVLESALFDPLLGHLALVSSFGAESAVLLHMVSVIKPDTPVLFVDTGLHFPETLAYRDRLVDQFGLTNLQNVPVPQSFGDGCCADQKTAALHAALTDFDGWITGRKRYQADTRAGLELFENEADLRIKVNPLAHWRHSDVIAYIENNALPQHPLVAQGYTSIGCARCTSPTQPGEDARAGRWRGADKTECGIHFSPDGVVRDGAK